MTNSLTEYIWIALFLLAALTAIAAVIIGVLFFIRFFKTRNKRFLAAGLLMTLILPGCLILLVILAWLPNAFVAYGPPPSNYVP